MKPTFNRIPGAIVLLVIAGTLLFATSCSSEKHKIDDSTVLPFKDKAELDSLLDLPILPEYTIDEYYTTTDFTYGDHLFVVCCKFLEEVPSAKVQEIVDQINRHEYNGWYTFDLGKENNMRLFFDLDTTLTADRKMPENLGGYIHISIEMMCREKDTWKGFEVVFRNNRADFSVVVDRDTLTKLLGVEFPPLTEINRTDEHIYYKFDTIPGEEFYKALEKAPHWEVSQIRDMTYYDYEYIDENVMITADLVKGETDFSFYRMKQANGVTDLIKRASPFHNK